MELPSSGRAGGSRSPTIPPPRGSPCEDGVAREQPGPSPSMPPLVILLLLTSLHASTSAAPPPPLPPEGPPPAPPTSPPACGFFADPLYNTDLTGSLGQVGQHGPDMTSLTCCAECLEEPTCTGFAMKDGFCYLKGGSLSTVTGQAGVQAFLMHMPPPPAIPPLPPLLPPPDSPSPSTPPPALPPPHRHRLRRCRLRLPVAFLRLHPCHQPHPYGRLPHRLHRCLHQHHHPRHRLAESLRLSWTQRCTEVRHPCLR